MRLSLTVRAFRRTHLCWSHISKYPVPVLRRTICVSQYTVTFCLVVTSALLVFAFLCHRKSDLYSTCCISMKLRWPVDSECLTKRAEQRGTYVGWCKKKRKKSWSSFYSSKCTSSQVLIDCTSVLYKNWKHVGLEQKNQTWSGFLLQENSTKRSSFPCII